MLWLSSVSAKLGRGLAEDTLVLLAELFLLPLFSRADTLLLELDFGRVNILSASPEKEMYCVEDLKACACDKCKHTWH